MIGIIVIGALSLLCMILVGVIIRTNKDFIEEEDKRNQREREIISLKRRNLDLESDIGYYMSEANYLKSCLDLEKRKRNNSVLSEEEEVCRKAIKKAMKDTHPDRNGGEQTQEFMEYLRVYKKFR